MTNKSLLFFLFIIFSIIKSLAQNCITINQQPNNPVIILNNNRVLTNNTTLNLFVDATSSTSLIFQWQIFNSSTNLWINLSEGNEFSGTTTNTLVLENINSVNNGDLIRILIETLDDSCAPTLIEFPINKINIVIHNFFTPNGDGFNDFFTVSGLQNTLFNNNKLQVFNRWGNMVYEKINYQNEWDGTANSSFSIKTSKKVPAGTYYYTLDLGYKNIKLSGWVFVKL